MIKQFRSFIILLWMAGNVMETLGSYTILIHDYTYSFCQSVVLFSFPILIFKLPWNKQTIDIKRLHSREDNLNSLGNHKSHKMLLDIGWKKCQWNKNN